MSQVDFVADGNYAWEWWYQFQVTDNISVTPAIYYLSRPYGDLTNGQAVHSVAIVRTTATTSSTTSVAS
jgi:carbohydrate-selective porin OprB